MYSSREIKLRSSISFNTVFILSRDSSGFFKIIREDVFYGYYSNPISWKVIGYFGPPQPVGYPDYAERPSPDNYISDVRQMNNKICQNCHFNQLQKDTHKDHINCMNCHEPHFPLKGGNKNG